MSYLINYKDIQDKTIAELIKQLQDEKGLTVKEIRLESLTYYDGQPLKTGCGVYLFKENADIKYVGKCSSRSFVERIPAHFDIRTNAWFNTILRLITEPHLKRKEKTEKGLQDASRYILNNYSIILINFEGENNHRIALLEDLLRSTTNCINKNTQHIDDTSITIQKHLNSKSILKRTIIEISSLLETGQN